MRTTIRILVFLVIAVGVGDFVLEVSQNVGANVWLARGLGAVTAGAVSGLGYYLYLQSRQWAPRAGT